jgi:xylan 1,4-beta-xylosidase
MTNPHPEYSLVVDSSKPFAPFPHIWRSIGYDEINWTYTPTGKSIFSRLAGLADTPYYIRNHNTFTSGNYLSYPARGSTNVYQEDDLGNPRYDWRTLDKIYDVITSSKCLPLVELGFMPRHLAKVPPEAYKNANSLAVGMYDLAASYPPRDYQRWHSLVQEFVSHCLERYGTQMLDWRFELWNEPDLKYYWMGTLEEYCQLYDYSVAAIKGVDPRLKIGGPGVAFGGDFLDGFLAHCDSGVNSVTGKNGTDLDFISFHLKGTHWPAPGMPVQPSWKQMHNSMQRFCGVIQKYPQLAQLPVFIDECDIDVGTIQGVYDNPSLEFRNTEYYATFLCRLSKLTLETAQQYNLNLDLITTWAFYFEGKRAFEGNRTLFDVAGLEKPVFQAFRLLSQLGDQRLPLQVEGDAHASVHVDGLASRHPEGSIAIAVWNFVEDLSASTPARVNLKITGLPLKHFNLSHYRIDRDHSNIHTKWQRLGSPEYPSDAEIDVLAASQGLELLEPPRRVETSADSLDFRFDLPAHGVSLINLKP